MCTGTWLVLLIAALIDPFAELRGVARLSAFLGMLAFPVVLTFVVLRQVERRVPTISSSASVPPPRSLG
jgi:hypothetical protein